MSKRAAMLLGPLLLAVAVYAGALRNPFVYDDAPMVVDNPSLRDLSNLGFVLVHQPFRPLVNVSYALDHSLWQLEPFGYHLTSLLLHGLNVLLLFLLCARLPAAGNAGAPEDGRAAGSERAAAALAAGIFAVHPLASEAVGYVAGRAEVLCASFFLAACLCFQGAVACRPVLGRRIRLAGGLACFGLALACKEVAAMLPAVLLLYDLVFLPPSDPGRRRRILALYLPLSAGVAGGAALRIQQFLAAETRDPGLAFVPNLLTQFGVIWLYLRLYLLPVGQSVVHEVLEVRSLAGLAALQGLAAGAALLGLAVLAFRMRRLEPRVAFGVLWFLLLLVPSSVIPLAELAAEHRTYLAGAGLALALAALLARAHAALALPAARARAIAWLGALALLASLGLATVARTRVWSDPVRLWADAARNAPGVFAPHYQLAEALRERGDCAAAIPSYRRALALVPSYLDASNNLGICLAETGELAEARRLFEGVLARDPSYPRARNNLRTLATLEASRAR